MISAIRILLDLVKLLSPVAVIFAPLAFLWSQIDTVTGMIASLAATTDQAAAWLASPQIGDVLALANTVLPVSEAFQMLALLVGLKATAAIVRIVKSWIPTVS